MTSYGSSDASLPPRRPRAPAEPSEVYRNFEGFMSLVHRAEQAAARQDAPQAAALAQVAGQFAWSRHPGLFTSVRLERLLFDLGRRVPAANDPAKRVQTDPRRVLHILTTVAPTGGHTRLARRWIEADKDRLHTIVLTAQAGPIPGDLRRAVLHAAGEIVDIGHQDQLKSAGQLRRMLNDFDVLVLHINPNDVVPLIALATDSRPPVIFMNHADHVFWLGVGESNVVASIRPAGERLAIERRGLKPERSARLPIPLSSPSWSYTRERSKEALGLSPDSILALTIAEPYKFGTSGNKEFLDMVVPLMHEFPALTWWVVGPEEVKHWSAARRATGGRLRAIGRRANVAPFYEAADIYVDSYPLGSLTSVLDASMHGIPVVAYCPYKGSAKYVCLDDPALTNDDKGVWEWPAFRNRLSRYVADARTRRECGLRELDGIALEHSGSGWQEQLNHLYSKAASTSAPRSSTQPPGEPKIDELDLLLPKLMSVPTTYALLDGIPTRTRLRLRNDLRAVGIPLSLREVAGALLPRGPRTAIRRFLRMA